ncbi:MAG TPA: VCBS repeat-containing protein, partial [Phycisphaerales bacterium]|nr:VCBS repeat-containing protein [Phycisphaerales bacterium]
NGTFQPGTAWGFNTGNGTGPQDIASMDWDVDGDLDLIVVTQDVNTLRIYLNNGSGTFTQSASVNVGPGAQGLAAADIDGDGDTDFSLVNRVDDVDGTATIVVNTGGVGGTTFTTFTLAGGEDLRTGTLGDFTGDGRPELAFAIHDERLVRVYRNNGNGTFGNPVDLFQGGQVRPEGVINADIDGDGDNDLLVTNSDDILNNNFVTVWRNNGTGTLSGPFNYFTGGIDPGALLAEDLDGDGDLDVATVNVTGASLAILRNTGGGNLQLVGTPLATGGHPDFVAAGDFDGNGSLDLTVTNRDANTMGVYLNQTVVTPPPCAADLGSTGGQQGADGQLNNNDFIVFIDLFFASDARADRGSTGGQPGADGQFNNNDFVVFIDQFFAGCP